MRELGKTAPQSTLEAIQRGWLRRCPHCGRGPLFSGFSTPIERCSACGLLFERNSGDTWLFTIVGDRIPIAILVVVIYFGLARSHPAIAAVVFAVCTAGIIWTAPRRWGIGIALHYLSRRKFPDPDDPIPD
jgi:uncharacterized protein (DUF983 family)